MIFLLQLKELRQRGQVTCPRSQLVSGRARISAEAILTPKVPPVLWNLVIYMPASLWVEGILSLFHIWLFVMVSGEQWLFSREHVGTSLVAQWLRIRLPMQGTWVRALVREDPTCRRATKPVRHNYWAHVLQLLKLVRLEPVLCNKRSHCNEKPAHCNKE